MTPPPTCPGPVAAAEGPHRLTLHLTAAGPVGLAFDAPRIRRGPTGRSCSADALRAWGDRLAARVTYLMEPLVVLEVDAEGGEAELRSQTPSSRDQARTYYEIQLHRAGLLHLRRMAYDPAERRRQAVPCQLTREALDRLADDLVATVG